MPDRPSPAAVRAWASLVRVQSLLVAAVQADLAVAGLPPLEWYDVLLELARAPQGRLRPFEIEQRVLLAQYNVSRLLSRLERAGLVAREPCGEDGRGQWVAITSSGRARQREIWRVYGAAIRRHVGDRLSDAEATSLAELLAKLAPIRRVETTPSASRAQDR
jgi:DNA-binding MarR family transcriptional regulator